ncbi:MAG: class I SAM-dependent methyltransferase [Streptosporangiaceae bacterium]
MTELSVRDRSGHRELRVALFSTRVSDHAHDKGLSRVRILEAGCGRGPGLVLPERVRRHITGIDLDTPALRSHTHERDDLDSWHLGDLRNAPLPPRAFDVVHADELIERITNAELVLDRMIAALKPGGLLLVRFTDRESAYGLVKRIVPRWMCGLLGDEILHAPPAVFEPVASLDGIRGYCLMRGLVIAEAHATRSVGLSPLAGLARVVAALSGGRFTAAHSELSLVIRKPENRFARIL